MDISHENEQLKLERDFWRRLVRDWAMVTFVEFADGGASMPDDAAKFIWLVDGPTIDEMRYWAYRPREQGDFNEEFTNKVKDCLLPPDVRNEVRAQKIARDINIGTSKNDPEEQILTKHASEPTCPYCGGPTIKRIGYPRMRCKACGKSWTEPAEKAGPNLRKKLG